MTHNRLIDVHLVDELGLSATFVDGLAAAVDEAKRLATDGDIYIMGGGDVVGQAIERGLADELRLHIAPFITGGGTPLFKPGTRQHCRQSDLLASSNALHSHTSV